MGNERKLMKKRGERMRIREESQRVNYKFFMLADKVWAQYGYFPAPYAGDAFPPPTCEFDLLPDIVWHDKASQLTATIRCQLLI